MRRVVAVIACALGGLLAGTAAAAAAPASWPTSSPPAVGAAAMPPAGVAGAPSFDGGATQTGWIPFQLIGNHIFLHVALNGHDTVVGLDSGSTGSAIDRGFAHSIGLAESGLYILHGSTGDLQTARITGVSFRVDNLTIRSMTLQTFDLTSLSGGDPLQMILGGEVFNNLIVEIDFANRRLAFHQPASFVRPPGAVLVPLVRDGRLRLAPVSIEGRPAAWFNFDLGDNSAIGVAPAFAQSQSLLAGRRSATYGLSGVGGQATVSMATLRDVGFASVHFTDVPAVFPEVWPAGTYSSRVQGSLGVQLLSRFWLAIDFTHDRLFAIPSPGATDALFAKDRLGLMKVNEAGGYRVTFVNPGSPALAAGLKPGDHIVAVDGRPVGSLPPQAFLTAADGPPGSTVRLTLADGAVRTVVLADYF